MVALTAANIYQVSHGHLLGAGIIGYLISLLWFYNAREAAHSPLKGAGFVYAAGACAGTMFGMGMMTMLWGGK
jgi:hypothetical protein